jgi:hypothetical protein
MSKKLTAWRAVHPDLRSSNGFRWPFPGKKAVAPLPEGRYFTRGNPCPEFVGDGLCLAKTWAGAASGGIPAITCLEVTYKPEHVLGEDADKVRVSECRVVELFDAAGLIRDGWMAGSDLSGSDLRGSDLSYSDLRYSNLRGSNLSGSDLRSSDLRGSDLSYSDLRGSDLRYFDLRGAYGRDDWDALVARGAIR